MQTVENLYKLWKALERPPGKIPQHSFFSETSNDPGIVAKFRAKASNPVENSDFKSVTNS